MMENFTFSQNSAYAKFRNGLIIEWKAKSKNIFKNTDFLFTEPLEFNVFHSIKIAKICSNEKVIHAVAGK